MAAMTIEYVKVDGTGACLGRAGSHTVIADRPPGKASGTGLGFNGAELLALSLGGCFCNDVHYAADAMGLEIARLRVQVAVELGGEPLLVQTANIYTECVLADGQSPSELLKRAQADCTIANSLSKGVRVAFD